MFIEYNVNPYKKVGDCVIRAIALFLNKSWEDTYWNICDKGAEIYDMPSSNEVWGEYLLDIGCKRHIIPNECRCYTVRDFCRDYPKGRYLLATGKHVITVINGNFFDTWNSGSELPIYYFER